MEKQAINAASSWFETKTLLIQLDIAKLDSPQKIFLA